MARTLGIASFALSASCLLAPVMVLGCSGGESSTGSTGSSTGDATTGGTGGAATTGAGGAATTGSGGAATTGSGGAATTGTGSVTITGTGGSGPACGDGVVQAPEPCDDGNQVDNDACRNDCTRPVCDHVDGSQHPAIVAMAANLGGGQPLVTAMANSNVPGLSVAIRDVDGKIYTAVFGNANNQTYDPMAPPLSASTLFQAGSISKAVSALAYFVSGLASATKDGNIQPALQSLGVPPYAITPAQLLSHSAGTAPHGFAAGYLEGDPLPTTDQVVLGQAPASSPAVSYDPLKIGIFSYSGGGYLLWQDWLEHTTNQPLGDYVRDHLLLAAGTKRSSYTQPLTAAIDHDASCGRSTFLKNNGVCRKVYAELAAAGLWTTPADLACITQYVTQQRPDVLPIVTSEALVTDFSNGMYPQKMGLGLFHRPANGLDETQGHLYEHSGVNEGFLSQMVFFDDGRAIVAMDNGSAANGGISGFAVRALCRELDWPCKGKDLAPN
jgi:cysteine-rich repeat protein